MCPPAALCQVYAVSTLFPPPQKKNQLGYTLTCNLE